MTQTVFTNSMVAHVWAQQSQDQGKNSNDTFYFYGSTIYSYGSHFPIAKFIELDSGQKVVLYNSATYSVTTSQHQSEVRNAIPSYLEVFTVPNVDIVRKGFDLKGYRKAHKENRAYMIKEAETALLKASRARSEWAINDYVHRANMLESSINEYSKLFKLGFKKPYQLPNNEEIQERAKQQAIKNRKTNAKRKAEKEKREKELAIENAEKLAKWRNGENVNLPYNMPVAMRLINNGETLQTSKNATCPASHLKLIWRQVSHCVKERVSWHKNGHTLHAGHFQIDSITAKGEIKAGCHFIKFDEVENMAKLMGFIQA